MAYDIRQYIDSLKHNPFWVGRITNDINKLLVNREYIDFFIKYIYNGAVITASNVCHILRKWYCHNSRYISKLEKDTIDIEWEYELKNDSMFCVQQL